ncbi:MAG: V-type ATP synthase subunit F [Candidatus Eisenbacteria bacterium]|nr:V-type ATP synthase subunit F [Candidatus Eisenbacteria bacterium]
MSRTATIAFIGDRDSVLGLRAFGVAAMPAATPEEARAAFAEAVAAGHAIVFVTEDVHEACAAEIAALRDRALPTVTVLPGVRGSSGLAAKEIHRAVSAAVGADILAVGRND